MRIVGSDVAELLPKVEAARLVDAAPKQEAEAVLRSDCASIQISGI